MAEKSKFLTEAERLSRKAAETDSPSQKRMFETQALFYEVMANEPESEDESPDKRYQTG